MQYIKKESRDQITFLPDCIEDYISEDNPVRVIDAFVDSLDLFSLGFSHSSLSETGRPPYDPADLLKLYIYGYMTRIAAHHPKTLKMFVFRKAQHISPSGCTEKPAGN